MNQEEVFQRLAAAGGYYQDDHIVLTSDLHSDVYANFRVFFEDGRKEELELFCRALAERFHERTDIDFVVGPKTGGAIIAERVAVILSEMRRTFVRPIIAFKKGGEEKDFTFYDDDARFLNGRRGLFVDDVLSTGSSLRPVRTRIDELGARIIAFGCMLNRSGLGADALGVSTLVALAELRPKTATAEECADHWLCKQSRPINTKVGHGAKFVTEHGQPS